MNLKTAFSIQDNNIKDLDDSSRNYPTLNNLLTEEKIGVIKQKQSIVEEI